MLPAYRIDEEYEDCMKKTDIEIAMDFLKLIETRHGVSDHTESIKKDSALVEMVRNVIKNMTNPFARELLSDRIS